MILFEPMATIVRDLVKDARGLDRCAGPDIDKAVAGHIAVAASIVHRLMVLGGYLDAAEEAAADEQPTPCPDFEPSERQTPLSHARTLVRTMPENAFEVGVITVRREDGDGDNAAGHLAAARDALQEIADATRDDPESNLDMVETLLTVQEIAESTLRKIGAAR